MPITRKVQPRAVTKKETKEDLAVAEVVVEEEAPSRSSSYAGGIRSREKKVCLFCKTHSLPTYLDSNVLRKFVSDRGRIYSRTRSGVCSKHQRILTKQIKYARHLAIFPFLVRV